MAKPRQGTKKLYIRVVIDVVCVVFVALPIGLYNFIGSPYKRGFFCTDESLKHPYLTDTVPTWLLGLVGMSLPVISVLAIEALHVKKNNCLGIVSADPKEHTRTYLTKCYRIIILFIFGGTVTQLLTEIGKYSVGRLRPHFFAACNPDWMSVNCSEGYIININCQGTNSYALAQMRLSFPSGHASISIYCMVFLVAYLQARLTLSSTNLIRPVLQVIAFSLAFYTCLSRISDYKHHWSDVFGGAVLGLLVCSLVIIFLCNFHMERVALPRYYRGRPEQFTLHQGVNPDTSTSSPSDSGGHITEDFTDVVTRK